MAWPPQDHLLFVYGTLRRGFARYGILMKLSARFVANGHVTGGLYHLGPFPGAIAEAKGLVQGEVYGFNNPEPAIQILYAIEEFHPRAPETSLFRRGRATVTLEDKREVEAWIYWLNRRPLAMRRVESGDFSRP